ncbi:hypothetical protein AWZ03_009073 [Drosophila navojoa]|uniref:CIDE-N domain-containing protein n=1 Tax=Drosophila navojoa TaxID=7232 RepID=A0A484B9N5_DRONA|nr:uncharacterized protein LOC108649793 [Drosophila navojoa]TDG44495.1 hypothetical protein AWZ03_009073 [Drosophila navojoa]
MDAAPAVAPHAANEAKPQPQPPAPAAAAPNENGVQTAAKKSETATGTATGSEMHSNVDTGKVLEAQKTKSEMGSEMVLITICSADRKIKKTFMSLPSRKDVIEKAHKYGLAGSTIVLESNGCEICEDEVLLFAAKEKILLMLLAESDEYVILPPPSPLNRSERAGSSLDPSFVSNANDSTVSNDETLSLASVTPSNSKLSTAPFKEFSIPWSKVPNDIMKLLRGKTSLGKRLNALANLLVDALRERSSHIPLLVFREVAQQAAEKYPDSLLEKDREGQQIATTPQSLISKMINRNNALNRPQKRASSSTADLHITSSNSSSSSKKRKSAATAVASNGNAKSLALNRDLEEKKDLLISSYRGDSKVEQSTIDDYMKECFPLQRAFFNNSEKIPDITAIKDNWPYIFNKPLLYQHFELLMSIDPRVLEKRFASEKERLFKFFKMSKNKKVNALEENNANIVRGLAYYFNEDPDYIFKQYDHGPLPNDVLQHINPTNAPWVALVNTPISVGDEGAHTDAMVYIEGQIMSTFPASDADIPDIIAQLICYYYTFNMMYPKEANQTLEFIVIYFLQHTPEQVRNSKKSITSNSKYNQLISKLANANG